MSLSYTYAAVSPKGDPTAVRALADLRDVVLCVLWCGAPYEQKAEDIQPKQIHCLLYSVLITMQQVHRTRSFAQIQSISLGKS
jgi:hypothetical protein